MPESQETPLRVLIVDDHPVVRSGLVLLLKRSRKFEVCGEAGTPEEAREAVERLSPEAAVVDFCLGGRDGVELIEDLVTLRPGIGILTYTCMDEALYASRVLRAGARGYLMKTTNLKNVLAALETISAGGYAVNEALRAAVTAGVSSGRSDPVAALDELSDRELQVFRLLGEGRDTAAIAATLGLSGKTVGTYRERLKAKLRFPDARELEDGARAFVRTGSLPMPR